jgi:hypothetical protein
VQNIPLLPSLDLGDIALACRVCSCGIIGPYFLLDSAADWQGCMCWCMAYKKQSTTSYLEEFTWAFQHHSWGLHGLHSFEQLLQLVHWSATSLLRRRKARLIELEGLNLICSDAQVNWTNFLSTRAACVSCWSPKRRASLLILTLVLLPTPNHNTLPWKCRSGEPTGSARSKFWNSDAFHSHACEQN